MLDWLNDQSGSLAAIASVLLTIITAYYVYLTWRLLRESKEAREANLRPEVSLFLRPYEAGMSFVILCLENVGQGPAYDLALSPSYDFKDRDRAPLSEVGPFRKGLRYLAPGQRIEHFLTNVIGQLEELKKAPISVDATYRDALGKRYKVSFVLDFAEMENLSTIGTPPVHDIANAMKQIRDDLRHFMTGFRKPTVLTESVHDYQARETTNFLSLRIRNLTDKQREAIDELINKFEREKESFGLREDEDKEPTSEAG